MDPNLLVRTVAAVVFIAAEQVLPAPLSAVDGELGERLAFRDSRGAGEEPRLVDALIDTIRPK